MHGNSRKVNVFKAIVSNIVKVVPSKRQIVVFMFLFLDGLKKEGLTLSIFLFWMGLSS